MLRTNWRRGSGRRYRPDSSPAERCDGFATDEGTGHDHITHQVYRLNNRIMSLNHETVGGTMANTSYRFASNTQQICP